MSSGQAHYKSLSCMQACGHGWIIFAHTPPNLDLVLPRAVPRGRKTHQAFFRFHRGLQLSNLVTGSGRKGLLVPQGLRPAVGLIVGAPVAAAAVGVVAGATATSL